MQTHPNCFLWYITVTPCFLEIKPLFGGVNMLCKRDTLLQNIYRNGIQQIDSLYIVCPKNSDVFASILLLGYRMKYGKI